MISDLIKLRIVVGLIAVIATVGYLYTFYTPLKNSLLFEFDTLVTSHKSRYDAKQNENIEQRRFISKEIHTKISTPIVASIPIPFTDYKIPATISWHFYEAVVLLLFLISCSLSESFPSGWIKYVPFPKKFSSIATSILTKLSALKKIDRFSLFSLATFFFLFISAQIFLRHHGAYYEISSAARFAIDIFMAVTTFAMFLKIIPIRYETTSINGRRKFIAQVGLLGLFSIPSPTLAEKLFQSISIRHFSRPRYRKNRGVMWHKISADSGLYQHIKSKKFYYVNSDSLIRSNNEIKESHLIKVKSLALKDSDYVNLPKLTSSVFFENWALTLLRQGHALDALYCLESGCRYEIYRIKLHNEQKPNIRLFKLYAGLCRKSKLKHNLSLLKKEITHDKQLSALLQPPPERWLMTRASCFKQRWALRKRYNGVPLTSI